MQAARHLDAELDDSALVQAARLDAEAFGPLYDRYLPRVYQYLRGYSRREDDATDLTQHVFLQALTGLPGYSEGRAPFANIITYESRDAQPATHWWWPSAGAFDGCFHFDYDGTNCDTTP